MEKQDDATISATRAGNEEAFLPPEERPIAPGNPPAAAMMLSFFPTAEGYYDYENLRYIYQYKDHLGNIRVSYVKEGGSLKVMDSNDYYPFGLSFMKPAAQSLPTLSQTKITVTKIFIFDKMKVLNARNLMIDMFGRNGLGKIVTKNIPLRKVS